MKTFFGAKLFLLGILALSLCPAAFADNWNCSAQCTFTVTTTFPRIPGVPNYVPPPPQVVQNTRDFTGSVDASSQDEAQYTMFNEYTQDCQNVCHSDAVTVYGGARQTVANCYFKSAICHRGNAISEDASEEATTETMDYPFAAADFHGCGIALGICERDCTKFNQGSPCYKGCYAGYKACMATK